MKCVQLHISPYFHITQFIIIYCRYPYVLTNFGGSITLSRGCFEIFLLVIKDFPASIIWYFQFFTTDNDRPQIFRVMLKVSLSCWIFLPIKSTTSNRCKQDTVCVITTLTNNLVANISAVNGKIQVLYKTE